MTYGLVTQHYLPEGAVDRGSLGLPSKQLREDRGTGVERQRLTHVHDIRFGRADRIVADGNGCLTNEPLRVRLGRVNGLSDRQDMTLHRNRARLDVLVEVPNHDFDIIRRPLLEVRRRVIVLVHLRANHGGSTGTTEGDSDRVTNHRTDLHWVGQPRRHMPPR